MRGMGGCGISANKYSAGILEQSMVAINRLPSRNRDVVLVRQATWAGGIDSLVKILRILKYRVSCAHGSRINFRDLTCSIFNLWDRASDSQLMPKSQLSWVR
jgi:hypothetical protein